VLSSSIPFAKIILEYIEGVYLIQGESIESSLIPNIITNELNDDAINFIISTDNYDYQYANKGYYIIHPKQDESFIVNQDNLIECLKNTEKVYNDTLVDNHYYPFIISLLGNKPRNIEKIKRIGLANIIKMIDKALKEKVIGKDVFNINILANIIKEDYRKLLLNNYYCTDIDTQMNMLNTKDLYYITSQITDKFDNASLIRINNEFFTDYPMYIMELSDASKLLKKKTKNIFE
jgi:hypothetical protein